MEVGNVTTPFGRRPAQLAQIQRQIASTPQAETKHVNKWAVFRHVANSRQVLGLNDRALAVLNALLSFHPDLELDPRQLVVFPSNAQLSSRANGISGATLRRAIAALVDTGVIARKDSPNGKRYAHRSRSGSVEQAYGFCLSPLIARAAEFAAASARVEAEAQELSRIRVTMSVCRRDVRKLIALAITAEAPGDWAHAEARYNAIVSALPRKPEIRIIAPLLAQMNELRLYVVNQLEKLHKTENLSTSARLSERHIQNPDLESHIESESLSEKVIEERTEPPGLAIKPPQPLPPIDLVAKACPQITDYAPDFQLRGWSDLMRAATVAKSMLAISRSAWDEACEVMGPHVAAITIACILERHETISSPGGYLRALTQSARNRAYSPMPTIMALLKLDRLQ